MKNKPVYEKKKINSAMWIIECPLCSNVIASASEKEYLPEFSTCNCLNDK